MDKNQRLLTENCRWIKKKIDLVFALCSVTTKTNDNKFTEQMVSLEEMTTNLAADLSCFQELPRNSPKPA